MADYEDLVETEPRKIKGRPRLPRNREIHQEALKQVQIWLGEAIEDELGGMDAMFRALIRRAFIIENRKTGIPGNFQDTKLVLEYLLLLLY